MTGWRGELKKVSLTETLMRADSGLKDAKSCTDRLLEGDVVDVHVKPDQLEEMLRTLHELGVELELIDDPPNQPMQTDRPSAGR